jgi:DNA-binding MarR family transcriptional regulator
MVGMASRRHEPAAKRPQAHLPDATTELNWAVHQLAVAGAELDAAIARRMGLTAGDYLALKHLAVSSEPLGPVELGRMVGLSSGAATALVDRLEHGGYARRTPHETDRRRQIVSATPWAHQRLLQELQPLATDIDRATAGLTTDQRRIVSAMLVELAALHRSHAR